jgi:hypothetical protein
MRQNALELLTSYLEALASRPSLQDLADMRKKLDSTVFRAAIHQVAWFSNDPELSDALRELQRSAESLIAQMQDEREALRIGGIGGGAALIGGSIIAALTVPVVGAFGFIGVFGGGWLIGTSSVRSRSRSREIEVLRQIADALVRLNTKE